MIRFLLFFRLEWCERHPRLMAAWLLACMVLIAALDTPR